jgi:hypothetical protein
METFNLTSSSGPGDPALFFLLGLILAGVMVAILTRFVFVPKYGRGIVWVMAVTMCALFIGSLISTWDTDVSIFNSIRIATSTLTLDYPFNILRSTTLSLDKIARIKMGMSPNWNYDPNIQTLEIDLRDGSTIVTTKDVSTQESEEIQSALASVAYPHCVTTTEQDEDTAFFMGHRTIWSEYFRKGNFSSTQNRAPGPI